MASEPMTPEDRAAIRVRLDAASPGMSFEVRVGASKLRATADTEDRPGFVEGMAGLVEAVTGATGPLTITLADDEDGQDATLALHAYSDLRRLLDENARLNAENERLSTLRDALVMKLGGVLTVVPQLRKVFGDGPVQVNTVAHLLNQALPAAPEMPRPPAEEPVSGPETPGTGSGRGTDERETHGRSQEAIAAIRDAHSSCDCGECLAEIDDALRPVHYREAAASLRAIAAANRDVQSEAYINGIQSAAGRLDSVARDLDDAAPSLPVPSTVE